MSRTLNAKPVEDLTLEEARRLYARTVKGTDRAAALGRRIADLEGTAEVAPEITAVLRELTLSGLRWKPNSFRGVDYAGRDGSVRLASEDEGYVDLYRFDTAEVLMWKVRFDNAPRPVISDATRAAVRTASGGLAGLAR